MFVVWVMMFGMIGSLAGGADRAAYSGERMAAVIAVWMILLVLLPVIFLSKNSFGWFRTFAGNWKMKWPVLGKPLAGMIPALGILLWNPVEDLFYYLGAFGCMGMVLWSVLDLIRQHNQLTMRKLPQFHKRGGDEDA